MPPKKEQLGPKGQRVLREFFAGKLRNPQGKKITSRKQAFAVAFSEQRAAAKQGAAPRTFRGKRRIRPRLLRK